MLTDHQGAEAPLSASSTRSLASTALAAIQRRWAERGQLYEDMIADANNGPRRSHARDHRARRRAEVQVRHADVDGNWCPARTRSRAGRASCAAAAGHRADGPAKGPGSSSRPWATARANCPSSSPRATRTTTRRRGSASSARSRHAQRPEGRRELAVESSPAGEIEAVLRRIDAEAKLEGAGTDAARARPAFGRARLVVLPPAGPRLRLRREAQAAVRGRVVHDAARALAEGACRPRPRRASASRDPDLYDKGPAVGGVAASRSAQEAGP